MYVCVYMYIYNKYIPLRTYETYFKRLSHSPFYSIATKKDERD